ncbi:hypothetical protein ACOMHN_012581 [Nucella lapillus]
MWNSKKSVCLSKDLRRDVLERQGTLTAKGEVPQVGTRPSTSSKESIEFNSTMTMFTELKNIVANVFQLWRRLICEQSVLIDNMLKAYGPTSVVVDKEVQTDSSTLQKLTYAEDEPPPSHQRKAGAVIS